MGSAPCLERDLERLDMRDATVMAINRAGLRYLGRISYWCSYHLSCFISLGERWLLRRHALGGNMDFQVIGQSKYQGLVDIVRPGPQASGSSTLYGVLVGLEMGWPRITVVGAPLDHPEYRNFRQGWSDMRERLSGGRVKSLSGWTKTFLEGLR